jgi:hypothetical protein
MSTPNFWSYAMEHPFLTFFAFDILVCGIVNIVKGKPRKNISQNLTDELESICKKEKSTQTIFLIYFNDSIYISDDLV